MEILLSIFRCVSASPYHHSSCWQRTWNTLLQRAVDLACQLPISSAWPRCFCTHSNYLYIQDVHSSVYTVSHLSKVVPVCILLVALPSRCPSPLEKALSCLLQIQCFENLRQCFVSSSCMITELLHEIRVLSMTVDFLRPLDSPIMVCFAPMCLSVHDDSDPTFFGIERTRTCGSASEAVIRQNFGIPFLPVCRSVAGATQ